MMLFDKDFDESLWCVLESDTEKRGEIIHFLKSISNELIDDNDSGYINGEKQISLFRRVF